MIIDFHSHLGTSPDGGVETTAMILNNMNKYGIDKSVVFASDEQEGGFSFTKTNEKVLRAQTEHPDEIVAFVRIVPSDINKALEEFKTRIAQGARGLKLKASDGFKPEQAKEILENIPKGTAFPVLIHTSHVIESRPEDWGPVVSCFPQIDFIFAHGGKDLYRDCAAIAAKNANVYIDTSTLSYHRTRFLYKAVGAEKILFGSDSPYSHPIIELIKFQLIVKDQNDMEQILGKNALKLLGL